MATLLRQHYCHGNATTNAGQISLSAYHYACGNHYHGNMATLLVNYHGNATTNAGQ